MILHNYIGLEIATNAATHHAHLIADCLEQSLEKLKPPSISLEYPTILSLPLIQSISRTRHFHYVVEVYGTFGFITCMKFNSKKSWSFALQVIYIALEFMLLTTEHKAYAVFTTTEFKEKFAKTNWSVTDVRLFCFIFFEKNLWQNKQNGSFTVWQHGKTSILKFF